MYDWKEFRRQNQTNADLLEENKPDIVCQLNENLRKIEEEYRIRRKLEVENEKKQEEQEELERMAALENEEYDKHTARTFTEEEEESFRKQEEAHFNSYCEERKKEEKEERKMKKDEQNMKKEEKKRAHNEPLCPIPERPLCEYEKFRERNIKEREDAMIAAGF